jgi:hypothetical protein
MAYGVYLKAAQAHPDSALAVDLTEYHQAHPEALPTAAASRDEASVHAHASHAPISKQASAGETDLSAPPGDAPGEAPRAPLDATRPSPDEDSA